jgi:uncharacterized repeat protein (TIGR03803 family)
LSLVRHNVSLGARLICTHDSTGKMPQNRARRSIRHNSPHSVVTCLLRVGTRVRRGGRHLHHLRGIIRLRFPINLRVILSATCVFVTALVPAIAQTMPGVSNTPLAVGTVGYGVIEAGDGNFYAMSLPNLSLQSCADNSNQYCSYIYKITKSSGLSTFHAFQEVSPTSANPANTDGLKPIALIEGTDGNLYGACNISGPGQFGTIFKITPNGTLTVLTSFGVSTTNPGFLDPGSDPVGLIQGIDGNLYFVNAGGVYSLNPSDTSGAVTTIATFPLSYTEGSDPYGYNASSIMQASDGNFYLTMGSTPGTLAGDPGRTAGAIVQVTPGGQLNLVHAFALDGSEGNQPQGPLVEGPDGYLYGTMATSTSGGTPGNGLAFKVLPGASSALVLLGTLPSTSSTRPSNALLVGSDGNLYGTSTLGGNLTPGHCAGVGCGTLFQMTPGGTFTTVYAFQGGSTDSPNDPPLAPADGDLPEAPVVQSDTGDFIGSSSGFTAINSPVFFDINMGGKIAPPIQLTVSPAVAANNTPVMVSWSVLNAFSDTAQNCGAVVQGGLPGISGWSGRQMGALDDGVFSGSTTITPTQQGTYIIGLVCGGNEVGFATLTVVEGMTIDTLSLPDGAVGAQYNATVGVNGGTPTYSWVVTGLPEGLTATTSGANIAIVGKPMQWGTANVAFTVTDSATPAHQATQTLSLKIQSTLKIIQTSFVKGTVGANYTQPIVFTGGVWPYTWTVQSGTMPPGLALNSSSGTVSGQPSAAGKYVVTFQVSDNEATPATATHTFTINIVPTVQIAAVEFTQAIQQFQTLEDLQSSISNYGEPPVPILTGRPAVMRVYFTNLKDATDVTLSVTGAISGMKAMNLPPQCPPSDARIHANYCPSMDFYFTPPPGAWETILTLTDEQGNQLEDPETIDITSRVAQAINLKGVWVCTVAGSPSSCQDPAALSGLTGVMSELLPTASVPPPTLLTQRVLSPLTPSLTPDEWVDVTSKKIDKLYIQNADAQTDAAASQRTDYVGMYDNVINPNETAEGQIGGHGVILPNTTTRLGVVNTPYTLAHEVGHTLNLYHTNLLSPEAIGNTPPGCWNKAATGPTFPPYWPYSDNYVQSSAGYEYGFDVADGFVVVNNSSASQPNPGFDLMSYCVPRWISPLNYKRALLFVNPGAEPGPSLRKGQVEDARRADATPRPKVTYTQGSYWNVGGSITSSGLTLDPIFTETMIGTSDPGSGPYSIQEQGKGGGVLFTRYFTPSYDVTETIGTDLVSNPTFFEIVPATPGTTAIAVLDPSGNTLTTVDMSGVPPKVAITSPGAGFIGSGDQTVSWTATSATATSFTSRIWYSTDAGTTWQSIEDTTGMSEVIDFDTLPGSASALIRVDVTDGVNTGTATSGLFSVPKKKPTTIVINTPMNGAVRPAADPIYLTGAAYSPDDGVLTGKALQWSDNIEGNLGSGAQLQVTTLKPGPHTITLTATDSDGNAITATTQVTLGGDPPAVTLTTANPNANSPSCYTATINATPGAQGADLSSVGYSLDDGATYASIPLTSLPFTFPLTGTGNIVLVATAQDASGQVGVQSTELNLGTGCTATTLSANGGGGQSTLAGTAFTTALSTLVVDQSGNPVSGATVTYSAPASGASATLSAAAATTNSSGIATVTATANSTAGSYSITATAPTGSASAAFALTNTDFQIAAASSTLDVSHGSSATDVITLNALDGFNGTVNFTCSGLAAGATCTFSPASITPAGASSTTTMTVAATASTRVEWPWASTEMLACMIFAFCYRRRRYIQWLSLAFALAIGSIALGGCGSSSPKQTPPVTSTVTVTATSGSTQRTTTVTVQIGAS